MTYLGLFVLESAAIILFVFIIALVWLAVDKFMEWKKRHNERK